MQISKCVGAKRNLYNTFGIIVHKLQHSSWIVQIIVHLKSKSQSFKYDGVAGAAFGLLLVLLPILPLTYSHVLTPFVLTPFQIISHSNYLESRSISNLTKFVQ